MTERKDGPVAGSPVDPGGNEAATEPGARCAGSGSGVFYSSRDLVNMMSVDLPTVSRLVRTARLPQPIRMDGEWVWPQAQLYEIARVICEYKAQLGSTKRAA